MPASAPPDSLVREIELAQQLGLRAQEEMYSLSIGRLNLFGPNSQAWLALAARSCLNRDLPDSGAQ